MHKDEAQFDVGGVRLARPFRIRRLGHFGVNVAEPERSKDFYCRLLGFRISDPLDFAPRLPEALRANVGPTVGYFARHGTDHHSFVFFTRDAYSALNEWAKKPQGAINQIKQRPHTVGVERDPCRVRLSRSGVGLPDVASKN